ncbi:MAG TPA: FkbM family methyltransferase [Baekduia sp.]|uniref:FkbM family methyltransferase n=1 Tax=Baekduia sp. TaxID=2600305 RepID=UPI002D795DF4|nr:FkbM family methyltransferase [Baekduia sp.]HET6508248.1 FkbM family methyltransferase [Baekduia sp.]
MASIAPPINPGHFFGQLRDLARLAPDHVARAGLIVATARLWIRKRRGRREGPLVTVRLRGPRGPLTLRLGNYTDLEAVHEVFVSGTYARVAGVEADTILDLGGNCGASMAYFKALHPKARIHVAEPDPIAFRTLTANAAGLSDVVLHQVAVGGTDERRPFYQSNAAWSSSLVGDQVRAGGQWIDVEVVSLGTLLGRASLERVDLLKLDVEGAEWEILPAVQLADVAGVVIGELHDPTDEGQAVLDRAFAGFEVEFLEDPPSHFVATGRPAA